MYRCPSRAVFSAFALGVSSVVALLAGCAGTQLTGSSVGGLSTPTGHGSSFTGRVHGGEQAIVGSTVQLYAAGASGYGSAATLLATTTTDGSGSYGFINGVAGPSSGDSYQCPSATSQIYITSVGGTTDGSGILTNTNGAAALLAAIGPCGALTSTTPVFINELTTVAAVTALAQYISPGTTAGTFSIGAPGSAQAQQGLANAVLQLGNLVSNAGGSNAGQVTSRTYAGATGALSTVAGVTVTATPESVKLNTLADVIAACVNQTTSAGANCVKLFAAATPPPASQTSHPLIALPTAADTVMAAYYMAVNPAQIATIGAPCNSTAIACEFGLVSGVSPFQNTLAAPPTDWTIGVTFPSNSTCNAAGDTTLASTGFFFNGPVQESVDASGNVWFVNGNPFLPGATSGTASPATIAAMSPNGQPLACPGSAPVGGRGVSVDVSGNVWAAFNVVGGVQEFLTPTTFIGDNGIAGITGTAAVVPASPTISLVMLTDLSGNVFYVSAPKAGTASVVGGGEALYELPLGGTAWTLEGTYGQGLSVASFIPLSIASDSKGRIWVADQSATVGPVYYYPNGTTYGSGALASPGTTALAAYGIAVADVPASSLPSYTGTGPADVVFSGTTCCGTASLTATGRYRAINRFNPTSYTANSAPVYAAGLSSGQSAAGLNGVRSLTVDGAANAFAGGEYPAGGDTTATNTFAIYEVNAALQAVSKPGTVPTSSAQCSTSATPPTCATFGGFQKADFNAGHAIAVDSSGTVWVLNTGFSTTSPGSNQAYNGLSITQVVGAGVPVTTPLSSAAAAGTLGVAP